VRDPSGELSPRTFLSTDVDADPVDILQCFVSRCQLEGTFHETRAHLGVETQHQWSDLVIMRTTPAVLGLFSLITLRANDLATAIPLLPRSAAWCPRRTHLQRRFRAARRIIWDHPVSCNPAGTA